jgi:hypothetical protein
VLPDRGAYLKLPETNDATMLIVVPAHTEPQNQPLPKVLIGHARMKGGSQLRLANEVTVDIWSVAEMLLQRQDTIMRPGLLGRLDLNVLVLQRLTQTTHRLPGDLARASPTPSDHLNFTIPCLLDHRVITIHHLQGCPTHSVHIRLGPSTPSSRSHPPGRQNRSLDLLLVLAQARKEAPLLTKVTTTHRLLP